MAKNPIVTKDVAHATMQAAARKTQNTIFRSKNAFPR